DRPWHGGFGHGVDLAGEEDPELASEGDAERYADNDPSDGGDRRLPSHGGSQLSLSESESLQDARSRLRRRTEATSVKPRATRAPRASPDARMRGVAPVDL